MQEIQEVTEAEIQRIAQVRNSKKPSQIKWSGSSRWSFGLNSAWPSIDTLAIGKVHPTLRL